MLDCSSKSRSRDLKPPNVIGQAARAATRWPITLRFVVKYDLSSFRIPVLCRSSTRFIAHH